MFKPIPKLDYHSIWDIDPNNNRQYYKKVPFLCYNKKIGDVVGWKKWSEGMQSYYIYVSINNEDYLMHRILYFIYTGDDPCDNPVDHIDGNTENNKKENLRKSTNFINVNSINRKKYKNNSSGITGVTKLPNAWKAEIGGRSNCTRKSIRFKDFFEACCWRKSMEIKMKYSEIRKKRTI